MTISHQTAGSPHHGRQPRSATAPSHRALGLLDAAAAAALTAVEAMLAHTDHTPVPKWPGPTDRFASGRANRPLELG